MKKTKNPAAPCSKEQPEKLQIFHSELNRRIEEDAFALSLLKATIPDWINPTLRFDIERSLVGFSADAALEIVDDLIDCWNGLGLRVTGIRTIDALLGRLYMRILFCAHTQGIKLGYNL